LVNALNRGAKSKLFNDITCPHCYVVNDCATSPHDLEAIPKPGDLNICIYCSGISTYTEDLKLRCIGEKEMKTIPLEVRTEIETAQKVLLQSLKRMERQRASPKSKIKH
jgi:hypothetical protein